MKKMYPHNKKRNYIIKVFYGAKVERHESSKLRRFLYYTRLIPWQIKDLKVYLKVIYGKQEDWSGKLVTFYNDGIFKNKKDFKLALNEFLEE